MWIEFKQSHGLFRRGQRAEFPDNDGLAKLLIRRNIAVVVEDVGVKVVDTPPRDKSMKRGKARRKSRGADNNPKG